MPPTIRLVASHEEHHNLPKTCPHRAVQPPSKVGLHTETLVIVVLQRVLYGDPPARETPAGAACFRTDPAT